MNLEAERSAMSTSSEAMIWGEISFRHVEAKYMTHHVIPNVIQFVLPKHVRNTRCPPLG